MGRFIPRLHEHILSDFLRQRLIIEHGKADAEDGGNEDVVKLRKGMPVPCRGRNEQVVELTSAVGAGADIWIYLDIPSDIIASLLS